MLSCLDFITMRVELDSRNKQGDVDGTKVIAAADVDILPYLLRDVDVKVLNALECLGIGAEDCESAGKSWPS